MPNIFTRVIDSLKIRTKNYWTYMGSVLYGESSNMPTNRDYLDSYEASFLVNACVRKISEKVANTKFHLYKISGTPGREKIDEVFNSPLLDLLYQVNPFVTKFEMLDLTQTYMELLGNAYWLKVRGKEEKSKILELWLLRPDRVRVIEDSVKIIGGYEYTLPNGQRQIFQPEEVIHFKQPNPKSSLYGLSTVKSVMEVIQSSIFTIRWNKNFFYNQARPEGLLVLKTKQTPDRMKELEKQWREKYGGVENAHKTSVIEGDADWKELTMNMRDMEFSKFHDITVDDILSAFGVPKPIVARTTELNRATAEAAVSTFLSETIEPKVRRIVDRLNEFLVPDFGADLFLDFEDPTPQNREATMLEYDNALRNNWMVINEVRDKEGLPPLDGGWDFYLPIMQVPAGGLPQSKSYVKIKGFTRKEYELRKKEQEQERLRRRILPGKRKLKLEMQLREELRKLFIRKEVRIFTQEMRKAYWQEHDKLLNVNSKLFKTMLKALFNNQKTRVIDAVTTQFEKANINNLIDWSVEKEIFAQISMPIFTEIIKTRGQRAAKLVGAETFNITDKIKKFIDKKTIKFATEVNDTTQNKVKEALKAGVDAGEGAIELGKRVADVFKTREGYDSQRIARTEVISASNEADLEAFKQSDVVEKKEWLATMDDRVRESHAEVNGEVVGLDEEFSNGLKFPGDIVGDPEETINCRCTLLPVVEA